MRISDWSSDVCSSDLRPELADVKVDWRIAERRSAVQRLAEGEYKEAVKHLEHLKAKMRARVEHPFRVIKRQFGYMKVRYRGLAKNTAQMFMLFALSKDRKSTRLNSSH